jgi:hypothetical protein
MSERLDLEGELLRLAANGYTVVLSTARGGWKAAATMGDLLSWDAAPGPDMHYATGIRPSAALAALLALVYPPPPPARIVTRVVTSDRRFPILRDRSAPGRVASVPWLLVRPHEQQARANHADQSLELLAERGGLSVEELWWVVHDAPFRHGGVIRSPEFLEAWVAGITDLRVAVVQAERAVGT